jgi:DNA-binding response OmpR family regulator
VDKRSVLIVDDDPNIQELLRLYFVKDGFTVYMTLRGDTVADAVAANKPDVIILDLMLPGRDGFDVLRSLRKTSDLPVIILTARGDTMDKVVGLELGADDYVEKPFEPKELIARVKAVLRRVESSRGAEADKMPEDIVMISDLTVDRSRYVVTVAGMDVEMPPKEMELLYFFASHPDRVFTREQILDRLWDKMYFGETRIVDVYIKRLREKLDVIEHEPWRLKTVWGVGYKFDTSELTQP